MDFHCLESFVLVAEMNSFTKAAEKLSYAQSTVSFQVKQLEQDLGTPLFERLNHRIKLTPKGSEILALAYQMLALKDSMEKAAGERRPLGGHIRLAMADSLCHWLFWDHFASFHRRYPDISLKVFPASTEEMFRLLKQNEVDLVYTLDKHIYNSSCVIASEEKVGAHFVLAAGHPLAGERELTVQQLLALPLILTEKGMSYRGSLDEYLARDSVELFPFLELGDAALICRLVEQNMGASFLPDYVTEQSVRRGKLRRLNLRGFSADIWLQLLYHRDKRCTPEMQCVIDYLGAGNGGPDKRKREERV